jgi:hypothetical protein
MSIATMNVAETREAKELVWANDVVNDVFRALADKGFEVSLRASADRPGELEVVVHRNCGLLTLGITEREL